MVQDGPNEDNWEVDSKHRVKDMRCENFECNGHNGVFKGGVG